MQIGGNHLKSQPNAQLIFSDLIKIKQNNYVLYVYTYMSWCAMASAQFLAGTGRGQDKI